MSKLSGRTDTDNASKRLIITATLAAVITTFIASFYPAGRPVDEVMSLSFGECYGWIFAQSVLLSLSGSAVGFIVIRLCPRSGLFIGSLVVLVLPWIYLADVLVFTWIGDRFISSTMAHVTQALLPAISLHLTRSAIVQLAFALLSAVTLSFLIIFTARYFADRWRPSKNAVGAGTMFVVLLLIALSLAIHPSLTWAVIRKEMSISSSRHPFCAFHLVGFRGVGLRVRGKTVAVASRLRALESYASVRMREQEMLGVKLMKSDKRASTTVVTPSKVILVVVECLRPEAISPELMPKLYQFSQKSLCLKQHFSGGNSTCLGMFSLLNGLESIWFRRKINQQPIYNRIMRDAGFQLGFFGGQTDWRHYEMDGFINDQQYDEFVIEEPRLPQTDLDAVRRTLTFIDQTEKTEGELSETVTTNETTKASGSSAHAALCYLYGTHSSFRYSNPKYQIFMPEAEEGLLISNKPELKEQFYNRYRNSLRSMDDILAPLLRDDCVVIVAGDHGEPFLDDGTASHGTRLSRYQNMTPAIIYYPGVRPAVIEAPTYHADLLPTLFSILNLSVENPEIFDGMSLVKVNPQMLSERSFISGNFIDPTSLLIGPWSTKKDQPFGYRIIHDIDQWQSEYLNPVDELGYEMGQSVIRGEDLYRNWFHSRFQSNPVEDFSEFDLLCKSLKSQHQEVRLAALDIVGSIEDPEAELIQLVEELASDLDELVRERAKELTITISRDRDWWSLFK